MKWFQLGVGVLLLALICAVGCVEPDLSALQMQMEDAHTELVTAEHHAIENYFQLQQFHAGLILECTDQKKEPYPQLSEQIEAMRVRLNSMQEDRAMFYNQNTAIEEQIMRKWKKRTPPDSSYTSLNNRLAQARGKANLHDSLFRIEEAVYDSLILAHGITFISHADYADSLLQRIVLWEDSFEAQGSSVARALQKLKSSSIEKGSSKYMEAYRPISEMQKLHKDFEATLTGVNNAHSRYEVARPTDGYYQGPYLFPRDDVKSTENIFLKLDSIMGAFRGYERSLAIE